MKLNNKGISIIEIVISFTLVMLMITGMLTIVVNYRNKAALSIEKLEMNTFKNTLTQDIQNDILTLGLTEINSDGECLTLTDLDGCINLVFSDESEKAFGTSKISANDRESIEKKFLYYDGIKYELPEVLPEVIPEGRNMVDLQTIVIENKNFLTTDTAILENGSTVNMYAIDVYISHVDFQEDFGIHIVASTDNNFNKKLTDLIFQDNDIIDKTPNFNATEYDPNDIPGLYKSTNTNDGKPTYYFRGNVDNNHVRFAGIDWRIIRINEDGTIRIRTLEQIKTEETWMFPYYGEYGKSTPMPYGIHDLYFSKTTEGAKGVLDNWYKENITNKNLNNKVATGNYFCEELRVGSNGINATVANLSDYDPTFKCKTDGNGYGLVNTNIALITLDEALYSGYQKHESNIYHNSYLNNYIVSSPYWWTMTPFGFYNNRIPGGEDGQKDTAYVWRSSHGNDRFEAVLARQYQCALYPVINLKANVTASGLGTKDNPYVID